MGYNPLVSIKNLWIMTKKQEREFLYKMFNGRCAYCGVELPDRWHADHKDPVIRDFKYSKEKRKFIPTGECLKPENDNIENKVPACPSCNIMKHSSDVEGFRFMILAFIKSLNEYSNQYKFAKKFGLISENEQRVVFHFERCVGIGKERTE